MFDARVRYAMALVVAGQVGCSLLVGDSASSGDTADASQDNAGADGSSAIDAMGCDPFQPRRVNLSIVPAPVTLSLGDAGEYLVDTAADPIVILDPVGSEVAASAFLHTQPGGPDMAVLHATDAFIADGATLRAVGPRPLVIAAEGSIVVEGRIDVGSRIEYPKPGAGADFSACAASTGDPGVDGPINSGGGGGGGGGFAATGGKGGGGSGGGAGGDGGAPILGAPSPLRAGCAGGFGGVSQNAGTTPAPGGSGGGAVQLSAACQIEVTSTGHINAGGSGGSKALLGRSGGGGGGSGGMIELDAPLIVVTGRLSANGGGGGDGRTDNAAGSDGQNALDASQAAGGTSFAGIACDSACGDGGWVTSTPGEAGFTGVSGGRGGEGGGGGVGFVTMCTTGTAPMVTGVVSPDGSSCAPL